MTKSLPSYHLTVEYFNSIINYNFTLILFNVLVYIFLTFNIFLIFMVFYKSSFSTNRLKQVNSSKIIFFSTLITLLSLAGIPPFLGFVGKFLLFTQLLTNNSFFFLGVFIFLNTAALYFYIQNIRFLVSKNMIKNDNKKSHTKGVFFLNNKGELVSLNIVIGLFLNIFGIFYCDNIIICLCFFCSFF